MVKEFHECDECDPTHGLSRAASAESERLVMPPFYMQATEQEFKRIYMCDFKPDEREIALDAELERYYNATEVCDNKTAARHWKMFTDWRKDGGYTQQEVNRAKRRVTSRLGI